MKISITTAPISTFCQKCSIIRLIGMGAISGAAALFLSLYKIVSLEREKILVTFVFPFSLLYIGRSLVIGA